MENCEGRIANSFVEEKVMYFPNPTNEQPKIEADSSCFALMVVRSKTDPEFDDLKQFSSWIDEELTLLEKQFVDFETKSSRMRHFQR